MALGGVYIALIARITRATMLEVLSQDYVRTAQAKGVGQRAILFVHALKNAAVPIVTVIGLGVALLIGGAVVTESVFAIPGLGRLVVDAILRRDYPVIQGVVLCSASSTCWSIGRRSAVHRVRPEDPLLSTAHRCRPTSGRSHACCRTCCRRCAARRSAPSSAAIRPSRSAAALLLADRCSSRSFAPWLGTVDPTALAPAKRTRPPSASLLVRHRHAGARHLFARAVRRAGLADRRLLGRDRLPSAVGMLIGLVSGFVRWLDGVIMRIMDGLMSIPPILLAIALMALTRGSVQQRDHRDHRRRDPARVAAGARRGAVACASSPMSRRRSPPARGCRRSSGGTSCPTRWRRSRCRRPISAPRR